MRRDEAMDNERACQGKRRTSSVWIAALLILLSTIRVSAAEPVVPAGIQATMAVRILEYDRALKTWSGGALTVGVVARSSGGAADFRAALAGREVQGVPIKIVEHAYRDLAGLKTWIERSGIRLLYLAPDVGAEETAMAAAAAHKLPTFVATRTQFGSGATLGLVTRDGKPHILVNLTSARAAGMDMDPKLLQLAEVVR